MSAISASSEAQSLLAAETKHRSEWSQAWRRFAANRMAVAGLVVVILLVLMAIFAPLIAPYDPITGYFSGHARRRTDAGNIPWALITCPVICLSRVILRHTRSAARRHPRHLHLRDHRRDGRRAGRLLRRLGGPGALAHYRHAYGLSDHCPAHRPGLRARTQLADHDRRHRHDRLVTLRSRRPGGRHESAPAGLYYGGTGHGRQRIARIIWRHMLPNVLGPVIVLASLGVGSIIILEAALSFLGLGVRPPTPSWGGILADGRAYHLALSAYLHLSRLMIVITVLAFNFIGDGLRDAIDPRDSE